MLKQSLTAILLTRITSYNTSSAFSRFANSNKD